jgi:membrane-bound lytic murein transglycosylase B
MYFLRFFIFFIFTLFISNEACARPMENFITWKKNLVKEFSHQGVSQAKAEEFLKDAKIIKSIINLDRKQPEFTRGFWDYVGTLVSKNRVKKAQNLGYKHRHLLNLISNKYGVQKQYLLAFWAVETRFGEDKGSFPIISALSTLAYDKRRSEFFKKELFYTYKLTDELKVPKDKLFGSWAGAMGNFQFMPSTFYNYAVDYDKDGKIDLWDNLGDAFASAANYLSSMGWKGDEKWGREVDLPWDFDWLLIGAENRRSVTDWKKKKVTKINGKGLPDSPIKAHLIVPAGQMGPKFLVYKNFDLMMQWNRSTYYALAISILADKIAGVNSLKTQKPRQLSPVSMSQVKKVQQKLEKFGFYKGKIDGITGSRTRASIMAFQKQINNPSDGYIDLNLLEKLGRYNSELKLIIPRVKKRPYKIPSLPCRKPKLAVSYH